MLGKRRRWVERTMEESFTVKDVKLLREPRLFSSKTKQKKNKKRSFAADSLRQMVCKDL